MKSKLQRYHEAETVLTTFLTSHVFYWRNLNGSTHLELYDLTPETWKRITTKRARLSGLISAMITRTEAREQRIVDHYARA